MAARRPADHSAQSRQELVRRRAKITGGNRNGGFDQPASARVGKALSQRRPRRLATYRTRGVFLTGNRHESRAVATACAKTETAAVKVPAITSVSTGMHRHLVCPLLFLSAAAAEPAGLIVDLNAAK